MTPGTLIAAKYRLERRIGAGAAGEVWAATNEGTGRPVALKLLTEPSSALRRRLLLEARAAGSLRHPNVVDVYDVGETEDGEPFLVMELLSGETLADRIRRSGRIEASVALAITTAIARALRAAHAKGVVHRDLKPDNVFLHCEPDAEGEVVKVLDFGVAKAADGRGGVVRSLVGSPAYMSPEQARNDVGVDARADLWSLGVVLFEMLAGRRPFASGSAYGAIAEVLTAPIPSITAIVPDVDPGLAEVIERCLTRDVAQRAASADEIVRLLRSCQERGASRRTGRFIVDEPSSFDSGVEPRLAGSVSVPPPSSLGAVSLGRSAGQTLVLSASDAAEPPGVAVGRARRP